MCLNYHYKHMDLNILYGFQVFEFAILPEAQIEPALALI